MNCKSLLYRNDIVPVILFAFCSSVYLPDLHADVFEIRGGGTITGKLLNEPSSSILKIRTNDGVELEIASSKVKPPIVVPAELEQAYRSSLANKEDSVELHRAVSKECSARDQNALSYAHKERVVELDPSDENWTALGEHSKDPKTGEWVRREVLFRRKGMANLGMNKWDTPQSKAIAEVETKQNTEGARIRKDIDNSLRNLNERGKKSASAAEFLNNLTDPIAVKEIQKLLLKEDNNEHISILISILAKMPGNSASPVFVDLAMNSSNPEIVRLSLELLDRDQSREYAFNQFLGVIGDPKTKPEVIDRAGSNIQEFPDKRAIPVLIERLISIIKRTTVIPGTSAMNKDGSGVSQSTGGTKVEQMQYNHQSVLSALVGLTDGANYQFDIPAWRIWYANTYAKSNLDLRRDE